MLALLCDLADSVIHIIKESCTPPTTFRPVSSFQEGLTMVYADDNMNVAAIYRNLQE